MFMSDYLNMEQCCSMNEQKLGKIKDNDWKESTSIIIATEAFEVNRKIKTYFAKQDKRPNLDGSLSIVENQEEIITVEVQIKTLPEDYAYKKARDYDYRYKCNINVFSVVSRKTTLNPVALIMVDIKKKLVFVKLLTTEYVKTLKISNNKSKVITFSKNDILDVDKFIYDVKAYRNLKVANGFTTEMPVLVDTESILRELNRKKKHYSEVQHGEYSLVYVRNNIRGYLSNFFYDGNKKYHLIMLKISDGIDKNDNFKPINSEYDECMQDEMIQIKRDKKIIIVNRSKQRTTASDNDVMNILYDISRLSKRKLIYYSAGKPLYIVEGEYEGIQCPLFKLSAKEIEKEW